jgi:hypothetical protein
MRWEKLPYTKSGDRRIRSRFLLFPFRIKNEVRWLEKAKWEEVYSCGWGDGWWTPIQWL